MGIGVVGSAPVVQVQIGHVGAVVKEPDALGLLGAAGSDDPPFPLPDHLQTPFLGVRLPERRKHGVEQVLDLLGEIGRGVVEIEGHAHSPSRNEISSSR